MAVKANTPSEKSGWLPWLVGRPWFWAIAIALLFAQPLLRTFFRQRPQLPPVGAQLQPFELQRETGEPFGTRELAGRVFIAGFLPSDASLAPGELGQSLLKVQHRLRHMGDSYRLVTFAVDPARDTVAAEAALAHSLHANPRAWCFVTGDSAALARIKADLKLSPSPGPVSSVFLIDQAGHVRGEFDPRELSGPNGQDSLVATLGLLANNY